MSYGKCNECRKFGTMECPTSSKCMIYEERPYFEPKEKHSTENEKKKWFMFLRGLY